MTVLLATYNGERTLPSVLDAYRWLDAPEGGWKLVIVDNGSTDSTPRILDRFEPLLPMQRLTVAEAGKNLALNAGLEMREGDLVVLTDDDAVPATDWLATMRRVADEHPEFDLFGGAVVPRWEREPERWLLDWVPHGVTYTVTPKDARTGAVPATLVFGPNMAVRSRLFDAGHAFETRIGPKAGTSYAMGSETEFTVRMEQLGHRAWFVADAVVEHMVRGFQMERGWILDRAVRYGRGMYRRHRQRQEPVPKLLFGMPRWQLYRALAVAFSLFRAKLRGDGERAFRDAWQLRFDWGYLSESRRRHTS